MIKLKSNQLSYKLFLALCILGSGIHVHAIESSTETINTFVRPKSVKEADRMLVEAAWKGDVARIDQLIQSGNPQVTQQAVQRAFKCAALNSDGDTLEWLLKKVTGERKVTPQTVEANFGMAAHNRLVELVGWLLTEVTDERRVSQQAVQKAFRSAVQDGDEDLMGALLSDAPKGSEVTQQTVEALFLDKIRSGRSKIIKYLLEVKGNCRVSQQIVQEAFERVAAEGIGDTLEWLLKEVTDDRRVTPQTVKNFIVNHAWRPGYAKTVNYLLSQGHIDQQVLQSTFDGLVWRMDLKDFVQMKNFAETHFPKEMYENSKELRRKLDQISEEELKTIMAIRTEHGRISSFAEYLLESVLGDKKWGSKKPWISQETATNFMSEQYHQDAMALMKLHKQGKLREQGTTKVSKLPKGVLGEVVKYTPPRIGGQGIQEESNEQDQAKKGGHGNQEQSREESKEQD